MPYHGDCLLESSSSSSSISSSSRAAVSQGIITIDTRGQEERETGAGHDAAPVADALRRRIHGAHVTHGAHDRAAGLHERRRRVIAQDAVEHGAKAGRCVGTAAACRIAGGIVRLLLHHIRVM
jgi:hypothetical protein